MEIVLLGAPGCGKGSLAKQISKDFDIPQISTGDLFRTCMKEESDFAQKLKAIMASGNLVSDEITIELVKNRIKQEDCKKGYILDGFPRNINQAKELEKITRIDCVVLIDVSFDTIIKRLSSRITCTGCGEIYDALDYKKSECNKCGAKVVQRDDDKPETIKHRLEVYETNTSPLINFYSDRLLKVSNEGSLEDAYRPVKTFLEKMEAKSE